MRPPGTAKGWLAAAVATLLTVACGGACVRTATPPAESEVRLAVLRQQVGFWLDDHGRESGLIVCLGAVEDGRTHGVDGRFLGRSTDRLLVRPIEACEARADGALERRTGRPAIIVIVSAVTWAGPREAIAEVEHFRSAVVSGRRQYRVVRELSRWICLGEVVRMTPS